MSQSDNFAKQNYLTGRNEFTSSYTLLNKIWGNFGTFCRDVYWSITLISKHNY